ncbi:hypothetical protein Tco_1339998 [Tanacetum coccineum]
MIAFSESRNGSKNMPRFSSNDMVHNYYLEEAKKKTQEKDRNSKSGVIHSTRLQHTTNDHKQKPRSNNQITRSLPVSKSSCVTSNVVPLVDHSGILIFTGYRFSSNKSSAVYEKTSPRSCLRWKPTGRIFDTLGLRWIPTGKLLDSCMGKVDNEPPHGSNVDISKIHECKQTLDLSVGTSINVQKKQSIDLSTGTSYNVKKENLRVCRFDSHDVNDRVWKSIQSIFRRIFQLRKSSYLKSSVVTTADASDKRQQQPDSTSSTSTLATTVTADGNFDL